MAESAPQIALIAEIDIDMFGKFHSSDIDSSFCFRNFVNFAHHLSQNLLLVAKHHKIPRISGDFRTPQIFY